VRRVLGEQRAFIGTLEEEERVAARRSRAGAAAAAASAASPLLPLLLLARRATGSSDARIHASPIGVLTGISREICGRVRRSRVDLAMAAYGGGGMARAGGISPTQSGIRQRGAASASADRHTARR
jgi:hypothetical protein